jgi:hypothetical protein
MADVGLSPVTPCATDALIGIESLRAGAAVTAPTVYFCPGIGTPIWSPAGSCITRSGRCRGQVKAARAALTGHAMCRYFQPWRRLSVPLTTTWLDGDLDAMEDGWAPEGIAKAMPVTPLAGSTEADNV